MCHKLKYQPVVPGPTHVLWPYPCAVALPVCCVPTHVLRLTHVLWCVVFRGAATGQPAPRPQPGQFQPLAEPAPPPRVAVGDASSGASDDQLVVDETPRKRRRTNKSGSTMKPGSLKMRLSSKQATWQSAARRVLTS